MIMTKRKLSNTLFDLYFTKNCPVQYKYISYKIFNEIVKEKSQKIKAKTLTVNKIPKITYKLRN